jgi:hypothetical protein
MDKKGPATVALPRILRESVSEVKSPVERLGWQTRLMTAVEEGSRPWRVKAPTLESAAARRAWDRRWTGLTPLAIAAVASAIPTLAWGGAGRCVASLGAIEARSGAARSTVQKVLAALVRNGWLKQHVRAARRGRVAETTIYEMVLPPGGTTLPTDGDYIPPDGPTPCRVAGTKEDSERVFKEARAREPAWSAWWRTVRREEWDALFHRYRAEREPFQSPAWKERAWIAAGRPA